MVLENSAPQTIREARYHEPRMAALVVGVAGGSGSGKSTVVRRLMTGLGRDSVTVIEHDRYYRDHPELTVAERATINYDHPEALDTELLIAHVDALRSACPVALPVYDFSQHRRDASTHAAAPHAVILIEGILVLADERLRALMDLKVFVDTDVETRFDRRLRRDVSERGRSPQSVRDQFTLTVQPMHDLFVEPSRQFADIVIREGGYNVLAVEGLLDLIYLRIGKR